MQPPKLTCERTRVRLAQPDDVARVLAYFERNGRRYRPALPRELLVADHWLDRICAAQGEFERGESCKMYVFSADEQQVIGTVGLTNIRRGIRSDCSLGYAILEEREGQGLMREAVSAAVGFAFSELGLHRIEATYEPANERSGHLLARLGFAIEGTARQLLRIDGQWHDHVVAALINDAWRVDA